MPTIFEALETALERDVKNVRVGINANLSRESIYVIAVTLAYRQHQKELKTEHLHAFEKILNTGKEGNSYFNAGLLTACYAYLLEGQDTKFDLLKSEFPVLGKVEQFCSGKRISLIVGLLAHITQWMGGKERAADANAFLLQWSTHERQQLVLEAVGELKILQDKNSKNNTVFIPVPSPKGVS